MSQLEDAYGHLYAAAHYGFIADEITREHVEKALEIVHAQWKAERAARRTQRAGESS